MAVSREAIRVKRPVSKVSNSLVLFYPGSMPKSPYCGCQSERGGGGGVRISGGKIAENGGVDISGPQKGPAEGATSKNVKNRQTVSKIFSTLFNIFRAGQKTSKIVKKCHKYFRHFSTIFARHHFSGPFRGALMTDIGRRYFGVDGRFSAVNRR